MMSTITRKSVLLECLEYERGILKLCSQNHEGRIAAKGEEDLFRDQKQKIRILQEMIHALDNESVRKAMADWQKDVILNGPTALELDGGNEPELKMTEGGI